MTTSGDLSGKIQELAATDEQFRAALLKDPHAAIEGVVGRALPGSITVRVVEETPDSIVIVLPPRPRADSTELSDTQLDQVSGGWCPWCIFTEGTYCIFTK